MAWWRRRGGVSDAPLGDWNDDPRVPGLIDLKRQILNLQDIGRIDLAVSAAEEGSSPTRELAAAYPDPIIYREHASMVYDLAGALTAAGNPVAAIDVLDESEQMYQRLGEAGAIDPTSPLLDVRARRADAMRHRGWTALATVEINIVAEFYYHLVEGSSGGVHLPGLTRALVLNADILSIAGDPSLACASADHAIHLITSNMDIILAAGQPVVSTLTLLDACRLSS